MEWWLKNNIWTMMMAMAIITYVKAKDHYRFFDWRVTYGHTFGQGIGPYTVSFVINGQYPGPDISAVTNDNLVINVHNYLDEPFLLSWNGVHLKKNSFQDGVYGTNCPIPPGENYTYVIQVKDQIGTFFYFPSLDMHKAAGGFGSIRILSRPRVPLPFPEPAGDFTFIISDWFDTDHKILKALLDRGHKLPPPKVLINGEGINNMLSNTLTVHKGKTYRFRISNAGLQNTLQFTVTKHQMKLVEVEGTYTEQNMYPSLDIHVGQSCSVLVTMDQPINEYRVLVSIKFSPSNESKSLASVLQYSNSTHSFSSASVHNEQRPGDDANRELEWSITQAKSIKTNLSVIGARGSPQGTYRYGRMKVSRTLILENSATIVKKKQRYAINGVSFVPADTPLNLADYFKIKDVFEMGSIPDKPRRGGKMRMDTSVMGAHYKAFVEIVFQNREKIIQSYHLDGYNFWVVGMDRGTWSKASRREYNLKDAIFRSTTQVYPESWTAIYVVLDNVGMWNLRSQDWTRQYLGQQFYLRVYSPIKSLKDEYHLPKNALLCGRASSLHSRNYSTTL